MTAEGENHGVNQCEGAAGKSPTSIRRASRLTVRIPASDWSKFQRTLASHSFPQRQPAEPHAVDIDRLARTAGRVLPHRSALHRRFRNPARDFAMARAGQRCGLPHRGAEAYRDKSPERNLQ